MRQDTPHPKEPRGGHVKPVRKVSYLQTSERDEVRFTVHCTYSNLLDSNCCVAVFPMHRHRSTVSSRETVV